MKYNNANSIYNYHFIICTLVLLICFSSINLISQTAALNPFIHFEFDGDTKEKISNIWAIDNCWNRGGEYNTYTKDRFGRANKALDLNNNACLLYDPGSNVENFKELTKDGYAISFWIKKVSDQNTGRLIFRFATNSNGLESILGMHLTADLNLELELKSKVKGKNDDYVDWGLWFWEKASLNQRDDGWYHIVLNYTKNSMSVFVANMDEIPNPTFVRRNYLPPTIVKGTLLLLGNIAQGINYLDDFKIFSKSLTRQEVNLLHEIESGHFSPYVTYKIKLSISQDMCMASNDWRNSDLQISSCSSVSSMWRIIKVPNKNSYYLMIDHNVYFAGVDNSTDRVIKQFECKTDRYSTFEIIDASDDNNSNLYTIKSDEFDQYINYDRDVEIFELDKNAYAFEIIPIKYDAFPDGDHIIRLTDQIFGDEDFSDGDSPRGRTIKTKVGLNDDDSFFSHYNPDDPAGQRVFISAEDNKGFRIFLNLTRDQALEWEDDGLYPKIANYDKNKAEQIWHIHEIFRTGSKPEYRILPAIGLTDNNCVDILYCNTDEASVSLDQKWIGPINYYTKWNIEKVLFEDPLAGIEHSVMIWSPYASRIDYFTIPGTYNVYREYGNFLAKTYGSFITSDGVWLGRSTEVYVLWNIQPRQQNSGYYTIQVPNYVNNGTYDGYYIANNGQKDRLELDNGSRGNEYGWKAQWTGYDRQMKPYYRLQNEYENDWVFSIEGDGELEADNSCELQPWVDQLDQRWQFEEIGGYSSNIAPPESTKQQASDLNEEAIINTNVKKDDVFTSDRFTLHPNPTNGRVYVNFINNDDVADFEQAQIWISDFSGKRILTQDINDLNVQTIEIDTSPLKTSIYVVTVVIDGEIIGSKKLSIVK